MKMDCKCVGMLGGKYEKMMDISRRVYSADACSPSMTTFCGGNQEVKILDEQNQIIRDDYIGTLTTDGSSPKHNNRVMIPFANSKGYEEAKNGDGVDFAYPNSTTRRGRVSKESCGTILCGETAGVVENYRIRKLTPKECWRLMAVKDDDFDRVAKHQSNSSLYHLAGDSIVVNVLMAIFKEML